MKNYKRMIVPLIALPLAYGCADEKVFSDKVIRVGSSPKIACEYKCNPQKMYSDGVLYLNEANKEASGIIADYTKNYLAWPNVEKNTIKAIERFATLAELYPNTDAGELAKLKLKKVYLDPILQDTGKGTSIDLGDYILRTVSKEGGTYSETGLDDVNIKYDLINKKTKKIIDLNGWFPGTSGDADLSREDITLENLIRKHEIKE